MISRTMKLIFAAAVVLTALPLLAGYYEAGVRFFMHRQYDEAREQLSKAVEASPGNGNAYYYLGETERNLGNYDKAIEFYQKAVDNNASRKYFKMAYWNLVVLTEQRGNYRELVKSCKIFWRRTGDSGMKSKVETLINKSIWSDNADAVAKYNGGMKQKEKSPEEALKSFREAIAIDGRFLAPKFEIGLMHYRKGNVLDAVSYFGEIVGRVPFYGDVHLLLGNIYHNQNSHSYAIEHLSRAIDYSMVGKDAEYDIYLKRGGSYFKTGDYARAKEDIATARRMKPGELDPLLLLTAINIRLEKYDEALESLAAIEKKRPRDPDVLLQMGSLYYRKNDGRYVGYFDRLYQELASVEKHAPESYNRPMEILAKAHYEQSRLERAKAVMDFIPQERWSGTLRLMAARAAYGLKDYDSAIANYEKLSLGSEDSAFLAAAYTRRGRDDRARGLVERYYSDEKFMSLAKSHRGLKVIIAQIEKERQDRERQERERLDRERLERERLERERLERERRERERLEKERRNREQAEQEQRKKSSGGPSGSESLDR